jgi:hypothetical protein
MGNVFDQYEQPENRLTHADITEAVAAVWMACKPMLAEL